MKNKYTIDDFIERAVKKHGDRYDYSKSVYVDSVTPLEIICHEHGSFFQAPAAHLRGYGCPLCGNKKRGKRSSLEEFIDKAREVHGDKYDYSKVEYINSWTKVCIVCHEHGEFYQTPMAHLNGQGCPKCLGRGLSQDEIISKFKAVHNDKYDYSKVKFTRVKDKVCIICPEHGEFWKTPEKHIMGQGCPKCSFKKRGENHICTQEEFINRATLLHGGKYLYDNVSYTCMDEKVEIICPKHGSFYQRPYDHLQGHGCPKCGMLVSKAEDDIYNFLVNLIGEDNILRNDRSVLNGKEIDIYIPSKKFGIEYNGLKWHSEEFGKDRDYHSSKMFNAISNGIRLVQIFEDEWINHRDLVLSKIAHLLHENSGMKRIMGRKCSVQEIAKPLAKVFLDRYHIQGYGKSTVSYGCFYMDKLIGVMSFVDDGKGKWNLVRFATDINYICQGVGGKLLKYFIKKQNPIEIKTFADRRWTCSSADNIYIKLGFKVDTVLKPDYHYINGDNPVERIHKFNLRKNTLIKKYGMSPDLTESEMVSKLGFYKIWDCGLIRYIWRK